MSVNLARQPRRSKSAARAYGPPFGGGAGPAFAVLALALTAASIAGGWYLTRSSAPSISTLEPATAVFQRPISMRYRRHSEVSLRLEPAFVSANGPGRTEGQRRSLIGTEMSASLRATGGSVQLLTEERLGVRMDQPVVWRWRVIPTSSVEVILEPTAAAVLATANGSTAPFEVFRDRVAVTVETRFYDPVYWFAQDHWQWIIGSFGLTVFGWLGKRRFWDRGRRAPAGFAP